MKDEKNDTESSLCPKCGASLSERSQVKSGLIVQRCSKGSWNADTRKVNGCTYVKWTTPPPEKLDERCPKCNNNLLLVTTRSGKKLKRCTTNSWDPKTRVASGCDYVEWM